MSCGDDNNRRKSIIEVDTDDPCPGAAATSGDSINQSDDEANNNDNTDVDGKSEGKDSPNWSPVSVPDFCDDNDTASKSSKSPRGQSKDESKSSMDPSTTEIMNDLVAVMESSHLSSSTPETSNSNSKDQPATCMLQTSQGKLTSSSTTSISASYSASTFTNATQSSNIDNNDGTTQHLSQSSMIQTTTSNSTPNMIRGKDKKMSWSDECGGRSLVEYFDEPAPTGHTKHWSSMRRKARHSFDAAETNNKGGPKRQGQPQVRVIKSALKRSGSYSPPVASLFASDGRPLPSSTNSCSTSSSDSSFMTSRTGTMKSFRSISVIGSSSDESDLPTKMSGQSLDTQDSMAGVTNTKLNANSDVQCVPSTFGNGGIIIPRGGPDSRYLYPRNSDPRYQLTLGAGSMPPPPPAGAAAAQQESGKSTPEASTHVKTGGSPNNNLVNGRSSPGHHHHHFLPRHANGYVSPQYGFYVNITPPTPELFAKHERNAKHTQTYHQFQSQKKLQAPSPIPEGSSFGETQPIPSQAIPQRFVGRSSVPRPSSNRATQERDSQLQQSDGNRQQQQNSLKPTFTQNKKGMGMLLAENPHHGAVWMG